MQQSRKVLSEYNKLKRDEDIQTQHYLANTYETYMNASIQRKQDEVQKERVEDVERLARLKLTNEEE